MEFMDACCTDKACEIERLRRRQTVTLRVVLLVNAACFVMLWRHRAEDINMRSVWLCSRNDLLANALVLAAALAVWGLGSARPDTCAGAIICALFLRSALVVAREAQTEPARHRVPRSPQQPDKTFLPGQG